MIRMKCEMVITDGQIKDLFRIYICNDSFGDKVKLTKRAFLDYVRARIILFGTGEFLVGNRIDAFPELTDEQLDKLMKWGLVGA